MGKKDKPGKKDKQDKTKAMPAAGDVQSGIQHAARSMRTFLNQALSTNGIYGGQDGVILALAGTDGLTAGVIATRLGVKPPTITRTLARMEAQGSIRRVAGETDARQVRAVLTAAGASHVHAIEYAVRATEGVALQGFTDKEVRQLARALARINRNLHGMDDADEELSE
jgi:DNA-binding MarR family transcriptional regulator